MPLPLPDDDARSFSQKLIHRIREEIEAAGGWLSFARYMELALYAPGLGYYSGGARKFGAAGDFITAPEISPLFGRVIAGQLAEIVDQCDGELLELGAGNGRLAVQILDEMTRLGCPAPYSILEVSGELRERQQDALHSVGLLESVRWLDSLPEKFSGVIFGNEVLDALPVHLIRWTQSGPIERGIIWKDNRFVWLDQSIADATLRRHAEALDLPPGYVSEINLAAPALVGELARRLEAGMLLFIDYGFGRSEYYHPQRHMGTLRVHYRHHSLDDPFYLPGLCDLTAHVDFTSIAEAGFDAGLELLGYTTQAQFLINGGLTRLLSETSAEDAVRYLPQTAAVQKLLSPAEMGELFKVIAMGIGVNAPSGIASGSLARLL
jgi:SAM-dependent MidA family methyltransferase